MSVYHTGRLTRVARLRGMLLAFALCGAGCTPESAIPSSQALSEEASSSLRSALVGRWSARGEVDGQVRSLDLEIEDHALRVAVDGEWEAWRAWVPLHDDASVVRTGEYEGEVRRLQLLVIHAAHLRSEGLRLVGTSLYLDSMPDFAFERTSGEAPR